MYCSIYYHQSSKKSRTLGNATVAKLITLYSDSLCHDVLRLLIYWTRQRYMNFIISSWDLTSERKRKKKQGQKKATSVINGDSSELTATCEQARKSSCSSAYRSACSCLNEKADWLARVSRGDLKCACGLRCLWGGREKKGLLKLWALSLSLRLHLDTSKAVFYYEP